MMTAEARLQQAREEVVAQAAAGKYKLLQCETANETIKRAESQEIPKKLIGACFHEKEVGFFFSDTGLGKSIFIVQAIDGITTGRGMQGFEMEAEAQPVLLLDFELSDKQFQNRYSENYQNNYQFSERFFRLHVDRDKVADDGEIETKLKEDIETAITAKGAKIVIVDNITWIKTETEKAKDALLFMKYLKRLQMVHGLSILILAHTPKIAESTPISVNDMAGSKQLMNFVDCAFALGRSHKGSELRYLKQVKVRACEAVFTTNNVVSMKIEKDRNFTGFRIVDYGKEYEHLKPLKEVENEIQIDKIAALKRLNPELSNREIARKIGTNHTKVKRVLDSLDTQKIGGDDEQPF